MRKPVVLLLALVVLLALVACVVPEPTKPPTLAPKATDVPKPTIAAPTTVSKPTDAPKPTIAAPTTAAFTPTPTRPAASPTPVGAVTPDMARIQYDLYCPTKNDQARQVYNAGTDALKQGKLADAQKSFQQAIDLDPKYCDAMDNLGLIYRQQGNLDQAISWYKKSIEINPNNPVSHTNLAVVYRRQGKLTEAVAEYQAVVRIDPNDPEGYFGLGGVYLSDKKYQDAITQLRKAEDLYLKKSSPYLKDARYGLGLAHYSLKEWAKAREYFELIYPEMKDDASVNYFLGICYLSDAPKNLEKARQYINRAKELGYKVPDEVLQQIK